MSDPIQLQSSPQERRDYASKLRNETLACRVHHQKLGVRKALSRDQLRQAADQFAADTDAISAAKKLLDTADPAFRNITRIRQRATQLWKSITAPYPEPGVRLIRKDTVGLFVDQMEKLKAELAEAAKALQEKYDELKERAQRNLGALFNPSDYPERIDVEFELDWDFPSIEPPAYLKQLHPQLYEQEVERIRGRFEEAVRLTEQALTTKLHELVAHLADRLQGGVDGKPKVFRDTAVANLKEFFEQFRNLDLGSNVELNHLVDQAKQVVEGVSPDDLRSSTDLRSKVADQLAAISKDLGGLMIERPKRAISLEDDEPAVGGEGKAA
jgi:hypothetical protein